LRTPPAGTDYPGKMLGIVGLIAAILVNLIGLVISVVAYTQSKKAGYKNTPALIGIAVGAVLFVLSLVLGIASIVAGLAASGLSGY
jgi:hypothetical protein